MTRDERRVLVAAAQITALVTKESYMQDHNYSRDDAGTKLIKLMFGTDDDKWPFSSAHWTRLHDSERAAEALELYAKWPAEMRRRELRAIMNGALYGFAAVAAVPVVVYAFIGVGKLSRALSVILITHLGFSDGIGSLIAIMLVVAGLTAGVWGWWGARPKR